MTRTHSPLVLLCGLAAISALALSACDDDDGTPSSGNQDAAVTPADAASAKLQETAALSSADEVPAPTGAANATGSFAYQLDEATGAMSYTLTVTNLTGPATAAHIHEAPVGMPGPIVVPLATPSSGTSSGTATLTAAQIAKIKAGAYYVNVHTAMNAPGEVRGQLDGR